MIQLSAAYISDWREEVCRAVDVTPAN